MQSRGRSSTQARVPRGRYTTRQSVRDARQIPAALGAKIRSLVRKEIEIDLHRGKAEITDRGLIASYNLMDGLSKTILVPGRPPLWTPSADNMQLNADSGDYYRDENAARFQDYPFEPAVRSIFHMDPSFDTTTIDIVACGSTLGNLLRFVQGIGEPFSFVVHTIGRTAFFARRDISPTELIDGVYGFGHRFVEANTTWSQEVRGSSSHQRIITYLFGGQKVLVRFEADGYTMDQADDLDADEDNGGVPVIAALIEDDFASMLHPQVPAAATDEVTVLDRGAPIAQSSTIDIKTRSVRKQRNDVLTEQLPRLWLRQIDNIVLSFHNGGFFGPAVVEDIHSMILEWEEKNQAVIARLANLIGVIKEAAEQADGGKLEVRCCEAACLHLHELSRPEQCRWYAIPDELRKRWAEE